MFHFNKTKLTLSELLEDFNPYQYEKKQELLLRPTVL